MTKSPSMFSRAHSLARPISASCGAVRITRFPSGSSMVRSEVNQGVRGPATWAPVGLGSESASQTVAVARPRARSSVRIRTDSAATLRTVNAVAVIQAEWMSGSARPSTTTAT